MNVVLNRIRGFRVSFVQSWLCWEFDCIGLDCLKPLCDHLKVWRRKFLLYFLLNNQLCLHVACILGFKALWSAKWHAPEHMSMEIWYRPPKSLRIGACIRKRLRIWLISYSASLSDGGQLTCSSKYEWNGLEFLSWIAEVPLVTSSAYSFRKSQIFTWLYTKGFTAWTSNHRWKFLKTVSNTFFLPVLNVIPGLWVVWWREQSVGCAVRWF